MQICGGVKMSLESAIYALADAIGRLTGDVPDLGITQREKQTEPVCMDAAGLPTKFERRCSICGELGRYARSHRDEQRDGTFHWVTRDAQ